MTKCYDCSEIAEEEHTINGRSICMECYYDDYVFICSRCEEYGDVEIKHSMVVVFEDFEKVKKGAYKVIELPHSSIDAYYSNGSGFDPTRLTFLKEIDFEPYGKEFSDFGHLCEDCINKMF